MTRKDVEKESGIIFIAPYCGVQIAESYMVRIGTNSGMYGWNWSAYKVPECAATIVTGYRSFPAGLYLSQQQMDDLNNARNTEKIRNLLIDWTLENRKEKEK
mgnify:CR=1 FL=1